MSIFEQHVESCFTTKIIRGTICNSQATFVPPFMYRQARYEEPDFGHLLVPSSEAGPDYVQLASQKEELERTERRRRERWEAKQITTMDPSAG